MSRRFTEPLAAYAALIVLAMAGALLPNWHAFSSIALDVTGLLLVSAFHELGHGLVAAALGYRFLFMVVGPLRFEETPTGPRVSINRAWEYAGGVCACLPEHVPDDRLRRAHMLQYLAGPVASIIIAAAVFAIGGRGLTLPAALLGAASFGVGVASLIPSRQGAMVSDGLGFRILARGGHDAEMLLHRVRLSAAMYSNVRPAAWRLEDATALAEELAQHPLTPADRGWQGQINDRAVLYYHLVDRGDIDGAGALLGATDDTDITASSRSTPVQALALLRAFHIAWYRKDAAAARHLLGLIGRVNPLLESDWHRALAAILIAEGDLGSARMALSLAKARFARQLAPTSAGAMEQRWLDELTAAAG